MGLALSVIENRIDLMIFGMSDYNPFTYSGITIFYSPYLSMVIGSAVFDTLRTAGVIWKIKSRPKDGVITDGHLLLWNVSIVLHMAVRNRD